jgi:hypothetical protein
MAIFMTAGKGRRITKIHNIDVNNTLALRSGAFYYTYLSMCLGFDFSRVATLYKFTPLLCDSSKGF